MPQSRRGFAENPSRGDERQADTSTNLVDIIEGWNGEHRQGANKLGTPYMGPAR
jgi:hypothetical protein